VSEGTHGGRGGASQREQGSFSCYMNLPGGIRGGTLQRRGRAKPAPTAPEPGETGPETESMTAPWLRSRGRLGPERKRRSAP